VKFVPLIRDLAKRFFLPVPDIQLGILFILNILVYKAFKPLSLEFRGHGRGLEEIEEFNFALILFLIPFVWLSFSKTPKDRTPEQGQEDGENVNAISNTHN
jgi:hypothetical protein